MNESLACFTGVHHNMHTRTAYFGTPQKQQLQYYARKCRDVVEALQSQSPVSDPVHQTLSVTLYVLTDLPDVLGVLLMALCEEDDDGGECTE